MDKKLQWNMQKERPSHSEVFLNFIGTEIEHRLSTNPSKTII